MKKLQICVAALAAAVLASAPVFAQTAGTPAKTKTTTMPQEKGDPESPKASENAKKTGPKKPRVKSAGAMPQEKGDPESPTQADSKKGKPKKARVKTKAVQTPQEKGDPEMPGKK